MLSELRRSLIRLRLALAARTVHEMAGLREAQADRRHVFVALAADYGNLGDLAITRAQLDFLAVRFEGAVVAEIPISQTLAGIRRLRASIGPHDVITLVGGGNTGDVYDDIQFLRERVISAFPGHPIISFPQTIEFTHAWRGRWASRRASRVYGRHGRLTVVARDSRSLAEARRLFPRSTLAASPDIVLTLDRTSPPVPRVGVVLSLRADLERGLDEADHARLRSIAAEFGDVLELDTHLGEARLSRDEADAALEQLWASYRARRLVVTDRLHGMIFAVITQTPCLALDSGTGKVAQFYEDWLHGLESVQLARSTEPSALRQQLAELDGASASAAVADLRARVFEAMSRVLPDDTDR